VLAVVGDRGRGSVRFDETIGPVSGGDHSTAREAHRPSDRGVEFGGGGLTTGHSLDELA
jgi:hypothetical protein